MLHLLAVPKWALCLCTVILSYTTQISVAEISAGSEGYIIVAGGVSISKVTQCYAYDINAKTWSSLPDLPTARFGGGLVTHNGRAYYAAGEGDKKSNILLLSTKQNMWIEGPPFRTIINHGVIALSVSNSLYVLGGNETTVEKLADGIFVWNKVAPMLQSHWWSGAEVLDGKIYVCGTKYTNPSRFCERYDPIMNFWTSITPMNEARYGLSMVALNGFLYVIGGADALNERYDPISAEWAYFSRDPILPTKTFYQAATTDGQSIYVVGGGDYKSNVMSMYSPESDTWQPQPDYPMVIYQASATFVKQLT